MYGLLAWTWIRAAAQYPVSMVLLALATAIVSVLDAAAILVLFSRAPRIAGFGVSEVLFLYGTSALAFACSDIALGTTERLGHHVREGTLDAMLVRPVSPLVQLATEGFTPRRLGKLVPAVLVLGFALPRLDVSWTPGRAAMIPVMVASGAAIFCGLWVLTGAVQFVLVDSHGASKSLTYGGAFLTQYPMTMFARDFVRGVTFVVPLAFVNWQPALYVLDRPDPLGLPGAVRFASPAVAAAVCAAAALAWRAGLRHYRSTGS
ncbi:ABC transporter permease [Actinomadura madurae]|uniref:ABC transporter permease n=1 Tax=Actinomadura madurae TaxID=1993 RepID=UPI0020271BB4|nr:ABC-2 family transporter protein [Actinomadura madurae]MCP9947164.1 ABC transporter permease [Actinomadura madurae]MCP9963932.1 ABC transporter permease [Actinomadura madurae]MCP9976407.1 ABC transporter permease [Actinomadura madurae]MCQ0012103.1 ABC transporter permease [Actinomadura madurae]MCQ0012600.1 ABC transporter permease [Actinomadura madurae]